MTWGWPAKHYAGVVLSSPANEVAWMAKDGAEARSRKARADVPDLILMDLIMPGTDGVSTTQRAGSWANRPVHILP